MLENLREKNQKTEKNETKELQREFLRMRYLPENPLIASEAKPLKRFLEPRQEKRTLGKKVSKSAFPLQIFRINCQMLENC